jgi:hypothetical protein
MKDEKKTKKGNMKKKWNAITLYDNEPNSYFRETYSFKGGIEEIIDMMHRHGNESAKDAEMLEKEYKKVKRLTRKQMLRLLSLTSNALLDYELH